MTLCNANIFSGRMKRKLENKVEPRNLRSKKEKVASFEEINQALDQVLNVKDLVKLTASYVYEFENTLVTSPIKLATGLPTFKQLMLVSDHVLAINIERYSGNELIWIDLHSFNQWNLRCPKELHLHLDGSLFILFGPTIERLGDHPETFSTVLNYIHSILSVDQKHIAMVGDGNDDYGNYSRQLVLLNLETKQVRKTNVNGRLIKKTDQGIAVYQGSTFYYDSGFDHCEYDISGSEIVLLAKYKAAINRGHQIVLPDGSVLTGDIFEKKLGQINALTMLENGLIAVVSEKNNLCLYK